MSHPPFLADTLPHADAAALIAAFGSGAAREAASRASRSRAIGNHLHFCRWREAARLIALLANGRDDDTLH